MRGAEITSGFRAVARLVLMCAVALLIARISLSSAGSDGEYTKARCAYNLMQLGKAIRMFADDHGGCIHELSGRVALAARGEEPGDNMERLKAAYAPYVHDPSIWYCPGDPYARTHTLKPPDYKPPEDQPDMKYDHYFTSYRHYNFVRGENKPPVRLDAVVVEKDELTASLPGGAWIATPDMVQLMMEDGCFHGAGQAGWFGKVYGRNVLFRDGHVKFETEETMRRPKEKAE